MPDINQVKSQYFESIKLLIIPIFPCMFFLAGVSDSFVAIFFDKQIWNKLPDIIMILAILGSFQATTAPVGVLYKLQKNTSLFFYVTSLGVLVIGSAYFIGVQWGLVEAILIHSFLWIFILYPVSNILIFRSLDASFYDFNKQLILPVLFSSGIFFSLRYCSYLLENNISIIGLFCMFFIILLIYYLLLKKFENNFFESVKSIIKA